MLIHFIRHTTPDIRAGICYGQTDIKLSNTFEAEAQVILNKISNYIHNYDAVFSSPLFRCIQLAQKIQPSNIQLSDKLKEVNFGDWELVAWDDIPKSESQPWMDDFVNHAPPNGESLIAMQCRVEEFIDELFQFDANHIAVVTHAGVLRLIIAKIMKIPLENIFSLKLAYGTVIEVRKSNNVLNIEFI